MLNASQRRVNKSSETWWYVLKTSWRYLWKTSWRCLEDILKTFFMTSWRRFEDVLKTCWQDVLKTYGQDEYIGVDQDVLKTSSEDVRLRRTYSSSSTRLLKTKTKDKSLHQDECLLGKTLFWMSFCTWQHNKNITCFIKPNSWNLWRVRKR